MKIYIYELLYIYIYIRFVDLTLYRIVTLLVPSFCILICMSPIVATRRCDRREQGLKLKIKYQCKLIFELEEKFEESFATIKITFRK
jgi:hypothetical protein